LYEVFTYKSEVLENIAILGEKDEEI